MTKMSTIHDLLSTAKTQESIAPQAASSASIQSEEPMVRHIAIIMDGNGRWATRRHLPRMAGHKAGVAALHRAVEAAADENVRMLSVYAFSTENWGRPRVEVDGLMRLLWETIRNDMEKLHRDGV